MARAARLRRPNAADVYWVLESQPFRPCGSLQAPSLALSQNRVALVATRRNDASVDALMLAVVAAETSRKIKMTVVWWNTCPSGLSSTGRNSDRKCSADARWQLRSPAACPNKSEDRFSDNSHAECFRFPASPGPGWRKLPKRRHSLLLNKRKRGIDRAIGKRQIYAPVRRPQDVAWAVVTIHAIHGSDLAGSRV